MLQTWCLDTHHHRPANDALALTTVKQVVLLSENPLLRRQETARRTVKQLVLLSKKRTRANQAISTRPQRTGVLLVNSFILVILKSLKSLELFSDLLHENLVVSK